jgi:hypothetical protein
MPPPKPKTAALATRAKETTARRKGQSSEVAGAGADSYQSRALLVLQRELSRFANNGAFRLLAAGGAVLPGMGLIPEALSLIRDHETAARLRKFDARLAQVEGVVGELADTSEFLATAQGRQHVTTILAFAASTEAGEAHSAAAHAYLSGLGLGRFDPDLVELLDRTLRTLTPAHLRVFGWAAQAQLGMSLQERHGSPLLLESVLAETGIQAAFCLKLVDDLTRATLFSDCNIKGFGGYWGTLHFCVSSFGLAFALYLENVQFFQGVEQPVFESPIPPSPKQNEQPG